MQLGIRFKPDISSPCIGSSSVGGPNFALFAGQERCSQPDGRLWRWTGRGRGMANDVNFTTDTNKGYGRYSYIVRAASSNAAVFATWVQAPKGACRLDSKRWRGASWRDVRPLQGLIGCRVHALVVLPSGGAVMGLESDAVGLESGGVWRLV